MGLGVELNNGEEGNCFRRGLKVENMSGDGLD